MQSPEAPYLTLVNDLLTRGSVESGRNGETRTLFGAHMRFSLKDHTLPLLTTKRVAWKTCLRELLWFLSGSTDNEVLQAQGVHIWDGNSSRAFLDAQGLTDTRTGLIGPGYGFQWRHFHGGYDPATGACLPEQPGVDQIAWIVEQLRNPTTRSSRRLLLTAWNPAQLSQMALPPCHVMCQFHVREGRYLSCALFQRSCDVALGVPFNIASYSMLTHLLAHHCGLEAEELVYFMGNCHLYAEHLSAMEELRNRTPRAFPTFAIRAPIRPDLKDYTVDDVEVNGYDPWPAIPMKMVV